MWQISEVRTFNELICKLQEKTGNQFRASIFSPNSAYEGVLINLYQNVTATKDFLNSTDILGNLPKPQSQEIKTVWKHGSFLQKSLSYVGIYQTAQNTGEHFKKTWLFLKGISCLQIIFVLIWMKQILIWFSLQRTGNGLSNIKDAFAESLQLQLLVLHQSISILKTGLSSSCDGKARNK